MELNSTFVLFAAICRLMLRIWFLLTVWFLVALPVLAQEVIPMRNRGIDEDTFTSDNVCGPRCVQYLLDYYHVASPDLIELVRQFQWPDIRAGSTLFNIQQVLDFYGVQTNPVKIPADYVMVSSWPIIVHLQPTTFSNIGHFVVLLPGTTRTRVRVWDMGTIKEMPSWEFALCSSGASLLTAPTGTNLSEIHIQVIMTWDAILYRCLCVFLCLTILIIFKSLYSLLRKHTSFSNRSLVR